MPRLCALVLAAAMALAACDTPDVPSPDAGPAPTGPDLAATTTPDALPAPQRVDTTAIPPDLLTRYESDAAARAEVTDGELVMVRAEAAIWSDAGLGCPEPGATHAAEPVAGFWVVFEVGGEVLDYRADTNGAYVFCPATDGGGRAPIG